MRLPPIRLPRPTLPHLCLLWIASAIFLVGVVRTPSMTDLGVYLRQGEEMATRGGLADVDDITHTARGVRFINGTWLAQRLLYRTWQFGGAGATRLLAGATFFLTASMIGIGLARQRGHSAIALIGAALADLAILQSTRPRPELFAIPLCAGYLLLAFAPRQKQWHLALGFILSACWAGVHGSFPLAPGISLLQAGGLALAELDGWRSGVPLSLGRFAGTLRRDLLAAGSAFAGTLANPYGAGIYRYLADNSRVAAARGMVEWGPPLLGRLEGYRLLLFLAVLSLVLWKTRGRRDPRLLAPALALCLLGAFGLRFLVWTGLVVACLPAAFAGEAPVEPARSLRPWLAALLLVETGGLLVAVMASVWTQDWSANNPVALTRWAKDHAVRGRLYQPMEWGGEVAWQVGPSAELFVDNRLWIFSDAIWDDYQTVRNGSSGWQDRLNAHAVSFALLDRWMSAGRLGAAMEASPLWERVYTDPDGRIYKRR